MTLYLIKNFSLHQQKHCVRNTICLEPTEGKNTPEQVGGQDKNKNYEQTLTLYSRLVD